MSELDFNFIRVRNLRTKAVSTIPGSEGPYSPRWSPDGRYIAAMPMDQNGLMLYAVAAGRWEAILSERLYNPLWSKDGRAIYFRGARGSEEGIFKLSLAGRRVEPVADFRSLPSGVVAYFSELPPEDAAIVSVSSTSADIFALQSGRH